VSILRPLIGALRNRSEPESLREGAAATPWLAAAKRLRTVSAWPALKLAGGDSALGPATAVAHGDGPHTMSLDP